MENRLCLNKKPTYKLPNEVIIEEYRKDYRVPNIKPDLVLSCYGTVKVDTIYRTSTQLWVKSNNKSLIDFLTAYNFKKNLCYTISRPRFNS